MKLRDREVQVRTVTDAAAAVPCSVSTLINLERAGIFRPARDSANRRLYLPSDIEAIRKYQSKKRQK